MHTGKCAAQMDVGQPSNKLEVTSWKTQAMHKYVNLSAGQRRVRGGGTLHHMAPELVSNYMSKKAGQPTSSYDGFACDMWALGVMLIQLMTGKLPFWPKDGFDYHSMSTLLTQWVRSMTPNILVQVCVHS